MTGLCFNIKADPNFCLTKLCLVFFSNEKWLTMQQKLTEVITLSTKQYIQDLSTLHYD